MGMYSSQVEFRLLYPFYLFQQSLTTQGGLYPSLRTPRWDAKPVVELLTPQDNYPPMQSLFSP